MALKRKLILLLSIVCLALQSVAFAEERITNFISNTHLNSDGTADVIEKIIVQTEGGPEIQHGIVRWMPGYFRDAQNNRFKIHYIFQPPLVNGLPAVYHMRYADGSMAYYLGAENRILPPGTYTYILRYRVLNSITYTQNSDQFYWNVTGNFWKYPIDNVDASFYLPKGVNNFQYSGYTGNATERTRDFFVSKSQFNTTINFVTTRTLMPGEGLTIAVEWPKGFVTERGLIQKICGQFIHHNGNKLAVFLTLLLIAYFSWVWYREARRPAPGSLPVLFEPPRELSPSGLRFVITKFDMKILVSAIINMAAKGYLTIERNKDGSYTLVRMSNSNVDLTRGERTAAENLFATQDAITVVPDNRLPLTAAKRSLKKYLRTEFESIYFMTHAIYILPGIFLSMLAIIALASSTLDFQDVFMLGCILLFALTYLSNRLPAMSELIREFVHKPTVKGGSRMFGGSVLLAVIIIIVGMLINPLTDVLSFSGIMLLALIIYLNILFYHLLRARMPEGRMLMDKVEGFKKFLTDMDQTSYLNPPVKTPELYERYLPYAIALGVENNWAAQFADVKNSAGQMNPSWFAGAWDPKDPATFVVNFSKALGSSIYSGPADRRRR